VGATAELLQGSFLPWERRKVPKASLRIFARRLRNITNCVERVRFHRSLSAMPHCPVFLHGLIAVAGGILGLIFWLGSNTHKGIGLSRYGECPLYPNNGHARRRSAMCQKRTSDSDQVTRIGEGTGHREPRVSRKCSHVTEVAIKLIVRVLIDLQQISRRA
jgi:hypothetical protein